MRHLRLWVLVGVVCLSASLAGVARADDLNLGARAGAGTDITGGIAYGLGINNLLDSGMELGVMAFGGSFEEDTTETFTYHETTDVLVLVVMANFLYGYEPDFPGMFGVAGVGLGFVSIEWEESSAGDTSLGTPLPGGGSKQSEDATGGGSVLNLGLGWSSGANFDVRAEIPIIITFAAPGEASAVIPTFTLTAGYRF